MKKRILVLSAIMFVLSVNLHAQVTIGSANAPKEGAILDLNSGAKGGLILSNVSINDPEVIPSGFAGMDGVDIATAKAQLPGALVYNLNDNTCTGILVWDGVRWKRLGLEENPATGTQKVKIVSPEESKILGGDVVTFEIESPPADAKMYTWYVSGNGGVTYEYAVTRTVNSFSKEFAAGNYRVKAVLDNCRSLETSMEKSFATKSVSPYFGHTSGGNYICIYGNFPYASTDDYVQNDLLAMYDAINNTGLGDKSHDPAATTWKDLTNHGYDGILHGCTWMPNTLSFNGVSDYVELPDALDIQLPATAEIAVKTITSSNGIFLYDRNQHVSFGYYNPIGRFIATGGTTFRPTYDIADRIDGEITTFAMRYPITFPDVDVYLDGHEIMPTAGEDNAWFACANHTNIGRRDIGGGCIYPTGYLDGNIYNLRIYSRELTDTEIAQNAACDQKRYIAPPIVTIDGEACEDVVVFSPNFLMCKVPASKTGTGPKDIDVTNSDGTIPYTSVTGGYTYVGDTDFYISSITPITGGSGDPLTFTGNRLDEISTVEVGGKPCTYISHTSTSYECSLPAPDSTGEVDIIITMNDNTTYRFARMFEYR